MIYSKAVNKEGTAKIKPGYHTGGVLGNSESTAVHSLLIKASPPLKEARSRREESRKRIETKKFSDGLTAWKLILRCWREGKLIK